MRARWLFEVFLALAMGALPLLLPSGRNLEYEYALLVSLLSVLLLPYSSLIQGRIPEGRRPRLIYLLWLFIIGPILVVIPGALMFLFRACPCSPDEFRFWMVVQWYPSWLLGGALAQVLLKVRRTYELSKIRAALVYACILALFILSLAAILWFLPQKRVTHFLVGFIHGPIYDEWIPVDDGIILQRVAHLFLATTLISLAWWRRRWLQTTGLMISMLLFIGFSHKASQFPSVQNGQRYLNRLMPYELKTADFTIHYAAENDQLPADIKRLFDDTVFHVHELKKALQVSSQHVDIYIYPDRRSMKLWFGGEQTDITDVFGPSVHITASEYPHETLRHELVHALASEFGFHGIGFHPNMAFTEGLAVALAPPEMRIGLDEGAAALVSSKRVSNVANLFSPLFWQESGTRSYTVAGSIVKYLLQHHGMERIRALYAGDNWDNVFGENRLTILRAWEDSLAPYAGDQTRDLQVASLYRNPGILYDRCPHTKAVLRREQDNRWHALRRPAAWLPKNDYWPWRLQLDPYDASARNMDWQSRMKNAFEKHDKGALEAGRLQLAKEHQWPPKELEDVELQILLSDLDYFTQRKDESAKRLDQLMEFAGRHEIGDDLLRQAYVRQILQGNVVPELEADEWRAYVAGWRPIPTPGSQVQPWIITYLQLRRGEPNLRSTAVLKQLLNTAPSAALPSTFAVEWYRILGLYLQDAAAFDQAEQAYNKAAAHASSGMKAVLEEHARRMAYFHKNPPVTPTPVRIP